MSKPKVGDIIYSLNVGNAARNREQKLTPVTVSKVGRKYFYIKVGWRMMKYCLDSWSESCDYSVTTKLYKTEQQWLDESEIGKTCKFIYESFEWSKNKSNLSLDALREIRRIIEEEVV